MRQNINVYDEMFTNDSRRFYPETHPVVVHEPLKTNFIILESPEDIRKGLLSLVSFEKEDLIAQCIGIALPYQTLHTLQFSETIFYHDPFFAGYLLHSCDPNSELKMLDFTLHAIKDIKPFELITINYNHTEKSLYQGFNCLCGSPNCQKWISGYDNNNN